MSHFTRVRTQIREREGLVRALTDLHYRYRVGENLPVRGFLGAGERAEVVVDTGTEYDIGFVREREAYEAVADWDWGIARKTSIRHSTFVEQLNRQYAYNLVMDQAREDCLIVEEEETLDNGDVVIVLAERE
jgi:hypothetical protein